MVNIDWKDVEENLTIGLTIEETASAIGVSKKTLYLEAEKKNIDLGELKQKCLAAGKSFVRKQLWSKIEQRDLGAMIYWDKTNGGAVESTKSEMKIEIVHKPIKE